MIVGALTTWVLLATRGPRKKTVRVWAMIGLGVALVALSFAYFLLLPLPVA